MRATSHPSTILLRNSEEWKPQCMVGTRIAPPGEEHREREPAGRHPEGAAMGHRKQGV